MRDEGIPTRRPFVSVTQIIGAPSAMALSMVPTISSADPSSSRLSSLAVCTTPMRSSMARNLVAACERSGLELGPGPGAASGPAVREPVARLRVVLERGHGGACRGPRVDQAVLGRVVERVRERELLGGAVDRVGDEPAGGTGQRLAGGHPVVVPEVGAD